MKQLRSGGRCGQCGSEMTRISIPSTQFLKERDRIREHRSPFGWCSMCRRVRDFPDGIAPLSSG